MIIHEVNEQNFLEERRKGKLEIQPKFDKWNKLGQEVNTISEKEFDERAGKLCLDPTIWAYASLKDKQNIPLHCWYYQDKIINDHHRFIHVTAANQIGKTWGVCIKAVFHAINVDNASVMIISRSEQQSIGILDEIKWMMKRSDIDFTTIFDEIDNRTELHLEGREKGSTSVIRVFPPTKKILSFPATLVILDETGFYQKEEDLDPIEYYQQCVEPRTNQTKNWKHPFLTMGQIISITNPNGQGGLAYYLYRDERYHQYIYNWLASPENTLEEYKYHEKRLPAYRFASIYAAKYVSASGGFITLDQYERFRQYNIPLSIPPNILLFLGGDFASEDPKSKNTDWTTLYGVIQVENKAYPQNPRIRLVYSKEWKPGTHKEIIYQEIDRIKNLPGVTIAKFGYDKMGVGDKVKNDLIGIGTLAENQIEVLTYSLPNKSEVYINFQTLFEQDMLEGIDIPKLEEQLLALKVEQPVGSVHIKVHHKTEGVKDDHPDGLANACFVAKRAFTPPASITIVKPKVKSNSPKGKRGQLLFCNKCNDYHYNEEKCVIKLYNL